jgi:hypothetical protein
MYPRPSPSEEPPTSDAQEPGDERAEQLASLASRLGLRYLSHYPSKDPCGINDAPFRWIKGRPELSNVLFGSHQGTEIVAVDFALYGMVSAASEYAASSYSCSTTATCALAKITASAPGSPSRRGWTRVCLDVMCMLEGSGSAIQRSVACSTSRRATGFSLAHYCSRRSETCY